MPKYTESHVRLMMERQFSAWAERFGYNQDSRSAEKTYNLYIQQARDLNAVFPRLLEWWDKAREELAESERA